MIKILFPSERVYVATTQSSIKI